MKRYTEEYIYKYLDQELSTQQISEFEMALKNNPELKEAVDEAQKAHQYFSLNALEKAPEKISSKVMHRIKTSSKASYYRPSGLFSSTGFLLLSGILTAIIALLSMMNAGYIDPQSVAPSLVQEDVLTNNKLWQTLVSEKIITNSMLVIYGILAVVLLDRFVFHPFFRGKVKQLGFH